MKSIPVDALLLHCVIYVNSTDVLTPVN